MSQKITYPGLPGRLNKTAVNLSLFVVSIVIVTAIIVWDQDPDLFKLAGMLMVVISCFLAVYTFIYQFSRDVLHVTRKVLFILLSVIIFTAATKIVVGHARNDYIFLIPFAIIPVVIRTFYDARLALILLLVTVILCGFMVPEPFKFFIMVLMSGMAAIFTLSKVYRKRRLFLTAVVVFLTSIFLWIAINFVTESVFPDQFPRTMLLFAGNGFLVLISFPLIFIFEQDFLLLSDATLLELADTNQPLLRKFAGEAPGSFQHSLQVSNLAEEAARAIGANYLLVRAGAMYHDIGKIGNPGYFVENRGDEGSPHDKLDPRESARIIISHVKNGVNLAKNYKIPVQIIDFIRMHHGTSVAYFFYKKYIDKNPEEEPGRGNEKAFTYPGPKPFSKETAVVMMADAVEASSRTLASYTDESISELVERILYIQEQDGQFSEVPLTFKDMSEIKDVFRKRLANIYHARVVYPERD